MRQNNAPVAVIEKAGRTSSYPPPICLMWRRTRLVNPFLKSRSQPEQLAHLRHCSPIRKRCSAIRTLLQSNSNNYIRCDFFIYIAFWRDMAGFRGIWRDMAGFIPPQFREFDLLVRN